MRTKIRLDRFPQRLCETAAGSASRTLSLPLASDRRFRMAPLITTVLEDQQRHDGRMNALHRDEMAAREYDAMESR